MLKRFKILILPILALVLLAGVAVADKMTIWDGNNPLMGSTDPVSGPAILLLLSTGLIGLVGVSRKNSSQK